MGLRAFTSNVGQWEWVAPTPQSDNLVREDPVTGTPLECSLPHTEFTLWGAYDRGMVAVQFIPGVGLVDEMRLYRIPFGATTAGLIGIIGGISHGNVMALGPHNLVVDAEGLHVGVVFDRDSNPTFAGMLQGVPVVLTPAQITVAPITQVYGATLKQTDLYGLVLTLWGRDGDGGLLVRAHDAVEGVFLYEDNFPWVPLGDYDIITPPGSDAGGLSFIYRDDNGETPNDIVAHTLYVGDVIDYTERSLSPIPAGGPYAGTARWPISIGTHTAVIMYAVPIGGGNYNYFITEVDRETGEFRAPVRASVAGISMNEMIPAAPAGDFSVGEYGPSIIGPGPLRITGTRANRAMISVNGGLSYIESDLIGAELNTLPTYIWQAEVPNTSEFWTEFDDSYEIPGPMDYQPQPWAPNRNNFVPPTVPINNDFANATALPSVDVGTGGNFADLQTLLNASLEGTEPAAGASSGSVWYSWVCPAGTTATLDVWAETGDTFNTTCDVFTGASLAALVSAATSTYTWLEGVVATSTVSVFEPIEDETFYIRVRRTDAGPGGPFAVYVDYD